MRANLLFIYMLRNIRISHLNLIVIIIGKKRTEQNFQKSIFFFVSSLIISLEASINYMRVFLEKWGGHNLAKFPWGRRGIFNLTNGGCDKKNRLNPFASFMDAPLTLTEIQCPIITTL